MQVDAKKQQVSNKLQQAEAAMDEFNPEVASAALAEGLAYLKTRLGWSGHQIAGVLHMHANTINYWIKKGSVRVTSASFSPEIQAVIHLLAIHRSLEAMFDDPAHQQAWLSTFHPMINLIPEEKMGESMGGLIFIRQYLDYVRSRGA